MLLLLTIIIILSLCVIFSDWWPLRSSVLLAPTVWLSCQCNLWRESHARENRWLMKYQWLKGIVQLWNQLSKSLVETWNHREMNSWEFYIGLADRWFSNELFQLLHIINEGSLSGSRKSTSPMALQCTVLYTRRPAVYGRADSTGHAMRAGAR